MAIRPKELSPIALAAAFLLVIHALLSGLAAGAHAAPVEIDAFGNALCFGQTGTPDNDTPADHDAHQTCCDFGCHSPVAATPALERALFVAAFGPSTRLAWRDSDGASRTVPDRASIRLRGPPLQA